MLANFGNFYNVVFQENNNIIQDNKVEELIYNET